jgi:hypothetical protein
LHAALEVSEETLQSQPWHWEEVMWWEQLPLWGKIACGAGIVVLYALLLLFPRGIQKYGCQHPRTKRWGGIKRRVAPAYLLCGETCLDCGAERLWNEYR